MTLLHLLVLGIVQGITEFLPISSSAHLVLVPVFTDWPDQGPMIDIAVHVGTLFAVMLYFWREVLQIINGFFSLLRGKLDPGARLFLFMVVSTIPVILFGFLLYVFDLQEALRSITVMGCTMLGFGIVLYLADQYGPQEWGLQHMTWGRAIYIGLAQALALIPGTSRAGICITAARFLGFNRAEAARYAMLLSIPTIVAAGALAGLDVWKSGDAQLGLDALIAGGLAFVTALLAIAFLMRWLTRATYTPFVIYRVLFGAFLLAWSFGLF